MAISEDRIADDIVDPATLSAALAGEHPPVLLDVRWTLVGGSDPESFRAGHLPGAVFVDLDAELAGPAGPGGRHPLPDPADLQATWRRAGIDDGDPVVVYDGADGSAAVRAWWLLRWSGLTDVRVLDGGLARWLAEGGSVRSATTVPAPGGMTVRPGGLPTVDPDEAARLPTTHGVLLDARAGARYRGEIEPLDPIGGHIPGAVNLPYAELYRPDGRLRDAADLRAAFAAAGVTGEAPVAASCGSGITACHLILAGRVAGLRLALYPGSYSQWCALGRPVRTGGLA